MSAVGLVAVMVVETVADWGRELVVESAAALVPKSDLLLVVESAVALAAGWVAVSVAG